MQTLKAGIIGCGVIGPVHAESLRKAEGVELLWACDLVEEKARKMAEMYRIPNVATDFKKVLADRNVDFVTVCTDHASHVPITVAAIKKGKHVLCEKALAVSTKGLNSMMAAHAKRPDVIFGGVFQHRFDTLQLRIRELIKQGVLGRILTGAMQIRCLRTDEYYLGDAWRGTWEQEGGAVLINQAIHYIDNLAWLMGGAEAVCGTYANLTHGDSIDTEDTATAALRFKNGALGIIEATASSHIKWEFTVGIHGTLGSVEVRNDKVMKVDLADSSKEAEIQSDLERCQNAPPLKIGKQYYGGGHVAQLADFVQAVRENRQPTITAFSARHAVDIVLGIYESSRKGKWITLPPADPSLAV
ncbi:MAG: hypothetical protein C0404_05855 [Verrucomicrobia bacterium]|nr:hypothetical protein [Verrucomicrobiota bacterium]